MTHECEFEVPDVEINGQRSHCIGGVFRVSTLLVAWRACSRGMRCAHLQVQFQFLETKRVRFRLLTPVLHPEVLPDGAVSLCRAPVRLHDSELVIAMQLMMNRVGYSKWDEVRNVLSTTHANSRIPPTARTRTSFVSARARRCVSALTCPYSAPLRAVSPSRHIHCVSHGCRNRAC